MKSALIAALVFISSSAMAISTVGMSEVAEQGRVQTTPVSDPLTRSLDGIFKPELDPTLPSEVDEAERQMRLKNARTLEEALQFMTPDEIAEEFGIPTEMAETYENEDLLHNAAAGGAFLRINVSIATQTMEMYGSATPQFNQVVSTGKKGYGTVRGCFNPTFLSPKHWSRKYNSPMPWAVFFYKGYALHETPYVRELGRKASHGCVRQSGKNAKFVYQTVEWYVKSFGRKSVTICVQ